MKAKDEEGKHKKIRANEIEENTEKMMIMKKTVE